MALVSRPIPSLLNGVSQQPPSLRRASQCEQLINGYPSLADALTKRPPSRHLASPSASAWGSVYTQTLNFGGSDRFILVLQDGDLKVYDTAGTLQTLVFTAAKTYLNVNNPITDFSAVTIEDVTYITNKTILTGMTAATASGTYKGTKQTFADVVAVASPAVNDVWKIVGDDSVVLTGYYVKYDGSTWTECANPGVDTTFDPLTMPHKLTWNGATTFTFEVETWGVRNAGSLTSLPEPNFVGRAIRDIFFHRNRLGTLAGEYCIMSRAGPDYQNWWSQSATGPLDNDPLDLRAANIKVSTLNTAVPFNKQLLMLSDNTQFVMGTAPGQLLTPNSASIDVATSYAANSVAHPVNVGNTVYFPSENTLFSSLREYYVADDQDVANTAEDVTAHIPSYIPAGVFKMALAENDDVLFMVTTGDRTRIYVYKYFWFNNEKVQNAWSYWQFDAGDTILSIDVFGSTLYALIERADGVHLEAISLNDDPSLTEMGFVCHLDKRVLLSGTYDGGSDTTSFTLPYEHAGLTIQVVKSGAWTSSYGAIIPNPTLSSTHTVTVDGDASTHDCYLGVPYTFRYRFSELFVREGNDPDAGNPILNAILHLRTMSVRFSGTGFLRAEVTPRTGATTYLYSFNGMVLGSADLIIGAPQITRGTFRFPVVADSRNVVMDLVNDTHMPSAIVSAEWSGNFTPKAGRR